MQRTLLIFCGFLIFLLLFVGLFHPVTAINQDLGRHLLLGKIISQTHHVPRINLLSYVYPQHSFVNSHWLSEVVFYTIYKVSGFNGLLVFATFIGLFSFFLLFWASANRSSLLARVLVGTIYVNIILERTDVRPELFSFLFLSIFLVILYRFQAKQTLLLFFLIPLELVWVNIHIYFLLGIVLLLFFFVDALVKNHYRLNRSVKMLGITLLLGSLATLCNPSGLTGALFPFSAFGGYGLPILENQSFFLIGRVFYQPPLIYFAIASILQFCSFLLSRKKITIVDWLLFTFFLLIGLIYVRNISLFAFATFFSFTTSLTLLLNKCKPYAIKYISKTPFSLLQSYSLFLGILLLLVMIARIISIQAVGFGVKEYGKKTTDFYLANTLTGPLYNNFDTGSYLAYRLYPKEKIFVDGRPEAYPKAFLETVYLPMQTNSQIFTKTENTYHFNTIVISHWDQTPFPNLFLNNMLKNSNYQLIYLDDYALIFVKKTEKNKKLIDKYALSENTFQISPQTDTQALVRYLYFFEKVGWDKQESLARKRLLLIDPRNCALRQQNGINPLLSPCD